MRHLIVPAALAVLVGSCSGPTADPVVVADGECAQPDRNIGLAELQRVMKTRDQYFPEASLTYLPARLEGRDVQWMAASWEGPRNGGLFLLDCDGKTIADLRVGAVSGLNAGPALVSVPGIEIPTIELAVGPGTALGSQQREVALSAFRDGAIQILWNHVAAEAAFAPSLEIEYLDEFAWQFSADGATITESGSRKVGRYGDSDHGWEAGSTHALPDEKFCWDAGTRVYQGCL